MTLRSDERVREAYPTFVDPIQKAKQELLGLLKAANWLEALSAVHLLLEPPAQEPSGEFEAHVIAEVLSHWFTQGGEAQFGALLFDGRDPGNADEFVSALLARLRSAHSSPPPNEAIKETAPNFNGDESVKAACLDCGLPYADFPLDVVLPRPQWLEIHPNESGLLCAACIVRRAANVPGCTAVHAILEIAPRKAVSPPPATPQEADVAVFDEILGLLEDERRNRSGNHGRGLASAIDVVMRRKATWVAAVRPPAAPHGADTPVVDDYVDSMECVAAARKK